VIPYQTRDIKGDALANHKSPLAGSKCQFLSGCYLCVCHTSNVQWCFYSVFHS